MGGVSLGLGKRDATAAARPGRLRPPAPIERRRVMGTRCGGERRAGGGSEAAAGRVEGLLLGCGGGEGGGGGDGDGGVLV